MQFLVDSKTILDFFNGVTELFDYFNDEENIHVSVVTQGELFCRAETDEHDGRLNEISSDFTHLLHIAELDEETARCFGRLKAAYPNLSDNSLWICATAIRRDYVILTNSREIAGVKEVVVKNY